MEEKIYNRIGSAIDRFLDYLIDCGSDQQVPKWVFLCLALITSDTPNALNSLIEKMGAEDDLGYWLNLELVQLINDLQNRLEDEPQIAGHAPTLNVEISQSFHRQEAKPSHALLEDKIIDRSLKDSSELQESVSTPSDDNEPDYCQSPKIEREKIRATLLEILPKLDEPFTLIDARTAVLREHPDWAEDGIAPNCRVEMNTLERKGIIRRVGHEDNGLVKYQCGEPEEEVQTDYGEKGLSYEMRVVIADLQEPFTLTDIRAELFKKYQTWEKYRTINAAMEGSFGYFVRRGKILVKDPGAKLWERSATRTEAFRVEPIIGGNKKPVQVGNKEFPSVTDAALSLGVEPAYISRHAKTGEITKDGVGIEYAKVPERAICVNGEDYPSVRAAMEATGIFSEDLIRAANTSEETTGGASVEWVGKNLRKLNAAREDIEKEVEGNRAILIMCKDCGENKPPDVTVKQECPKCRSTAWETITINRRTRIGSGA